MIRRGDIYAVDLDAARGSEAEGRRPAVIVSNDAANMTAFRLGRGVVTIVPISSNVEHVYPFQILLRPEETGIDRLSKAQAEQVRAVAVERIAERVGSVSASLMGDIDEALRLHLDL